MKRNLTVLLCSAILTVVAAFPAYASPPKTETTKTDVSKQEVIFNAPSFIANHVVTEVIAFKENAFVHAPVSFVLQSAEIAPVPSLKVGWLVSMDIRSNTTLQLVDNHSKILHCDPGS